MHITCHHASFKKILSLVKLRLGMTQLLPQQIVAHYMKTCSSLGLTFFGHPEVSLQRFFPFFLGHFRPENTTFSPIYSYYKYMTLNDKVWKSIGCNLGTRGIFITWMWSNTEKIILGYKIHRVIQSLNNNLIHL